VQVSFQPDFFSITIEDNGIGFSKDSLLKDGMGLHSLRSRIKAINGKIEMDSGEGRGVNAYLEFETAGLEKQTAMATS
jgi:signal transduction histidine kinase